jgi:hypothetical protein
MSSEEEINHLRESVRNTIDNAGIDNFLNNLASQANNAIQVNKSRDLDGLGYAILKLMMIDYLKNNFNK